MPELLKTKVFDRWLRGLKDLKALARILVRLDRLAEGHEGDAKAVGGGVVELRVDVGPGYRIYLTARGDRWLLLLCSGDKSSQGADIAKAKRLAKTWQEEA